MPDAGWTYRHKGDRMLDTQVQYANATGLCPICRTRKRFVHPVYGIFPTCYDWACFLTFGFGRWIPGVRIHHGPAPLGQDRKPLKLKSCQADSRDL